VGCSNQFLAEDFNSKFGQEPLAQPTINQCYDAISKCSSIVDKIRIPLAIKNACEARKSDGSVLEYGLDHHLSGMTTALDKGLTFDPRFPERAFDWITSRTKER
jgi:hypothetical protein